MHKDKEEHKAYMREYMLARYHRRRAALIVQLGEQCCDCGSLDSLEIDHFERTEKSFDIARALSGWSDKRVAQEAEKCVLRCKGCHSLKSIRERGLQDARSVHGTLSSYRHCKCTECRAAKAAHNKEYRARTKSKK